jgi:hypothetical protein
MDVYGRELLTEQMYNTGDIFSFCCSWPSWGVGYCSSSPVWNNKILWIWVFPFCWPYIDLFYCDSAYLIASLTLFSGCLVWETKILLVMLPSLLCSVEYVLAFWCSPVSRLESSNQILEFQFSFAHWVSLNNFQWLMNDSLEGHPVCVCVCDHILCVCHQ